jgi:hypothetical protein
MDAARLCEHCGKINFDALRCPSTSEIANLQRGESAIETPYFKASKGAAAHTKTNIGSLGRIKQDSNHCRLCNLIWQTLLCHNGSQASYLTANAEQIACLVEIEFYGIFWDPQDPTRHHNIRRLSILTKIGDADTNNSVHFAFQTCSKGSLSVQVDENFQDLQPNVDMLLFGGRKRPLEANIQWFQHWIRLCQKDHGSVCELPSGQDKLEYVGLNDSIYPIPFH